MQTDLLFDQFDTLLTTPDDVAHLEAAVLQLAVRGKLVVQDTDDEPATELFERILAKEERLIREGQIRKPKPLPPIEADEIPYELPESWAWVRLGEATNYGTSDKVKASDITDDTWVLDLQDIEKVTSRLLARVNFSERRPKSSKTVFHKGDVLYGKLRPYLDKVLVVDADGVCSSEIIPIRGYLDIDPYYLRYALKRPDFIAYVNSKTYGVKMPRLGTPDARMALLPLPPLAEQKRIVAKVDELLAQTRALATQLEQADAALVPTAQAAFQSLLDAQDTAAQNEAWQRIADHFGTLSSDPRTIEALKQTVLQMAAQGKLVPQNLDDEPASVLIERTKAEKEQLAQEEKIKKLKRLPGVRSEETPHELPEGWEWVRFEGITINRDRERIPVSKAERKERKGPYDYYGASGVIDKIDDYLFAKPLLLIGEDGANLILRSKPIAFMAYGKYWVNNHAHVIDAVDISILKYLEVYINATDLKPYVTGTAQPKMNQTKMNSILVALPPLAEQKRIVAKVEALLALCDALAAEVAAAEEVRARLLQAVLNGS